jgi:hypothetical protein
MNTPSRFSSVNYIGNGAVLLLHFLIAIPCYLAYGQILADRGILDVISDGGKSWYSLVAESLMIVFCVPKYATLFAAVAPQAYFPRTCVFMLTVVLGIITNKLEILLSLLGSVSSVYLAVFIPVVLFVRAKNRLGLQFSRLEILFLSLTSLAGLCVSVFGVIDTVVSL